MVHEILKTKILSGLVWKFAERIGIQVVALMVQIFLARMLFPEDYAVVALVNVIILVSDVFIHGGLGTSLVQKLEVDDGDLSSAFYLTLASSVALYAILFLSAPLVAAVYDEPLMVAVLRVNSLILLLGPFRAIQTAVLVRNMDFKTNFRVSMGGVLASGLVGLTMAYGGYGVWALVFSQMASVLVSTVILWTGSPWRPGRAFSWTSIRTLFHYGWKILCSNLIEALFNNLRTIVIGKLFPKDVLGYYNRGENLSNVTMTNLDGTISSVMFPVFSSCQQDLPRLKALLRRSLVTSCFVIFPAMSGLAAIAHPLVLLLLSEKWLGAVPFVQLCCLGYAFMPIHTANVQAIAAIGRSDVILRLEAPKKCVGLGLLLAGIPFGPFGVVAGHSLASIVCTVINSQPTGRLLDYPPVAQFRDVSPILCLAMVTGVATWSLNLMGAAAWVTLALQFPLAIAVYLGGARLLRLECLSYLLKTLKGAPLE